MIRKHVLLHTLKVLSFLYSGTAADWTYKSRPDLAPPHLNITFRDEEYLENGYLFVAPFTAQPGATDHGPLQGAPYILTDSGDLVWSGFTYFSIWAGNFQAAKWKGRDVLFSFEGAHNGLHGHGHGHHTFLDSHYQNVRELRAAGHVLSDKHEFEIVNEETALIQIYHPVPMDLSPYGALPEQQWIVDARFQELDIATGKLLFEWSSLDHVEPFETALPLANNQAGWGTNSSNAWDYFHINSITKGDDGHYLLSARHASTIYKINGTDGSIIWRLGGQFSDFDLGPEVEFGFQHHARYLTSPRSTGNDTISLFDNSVYGSESGGGGDKEVRIYPYSRGKYIELDYEHMTATLTKVFRPPGDLLVKSQGSLQTLPNSNVLINWGSEGQITEYKADGTPIFHSFLDSDFLQEGVQNYRAFKFNWTGYSDETPAAVYLYDYRTEETTAYVSWNGDTQTKFWRFYELTETGNRTLLGQVTRTGFETAFRIGSTKVQSIQAEALDVTGAVLATGDTVRLSQEVVPAHAAQSVPLVSYPAQQPLSR